MTKEENKSQKNNKPYLGDILGEPKDGGSKTILRDEKSEGKSLNSNTFQENEICDDEIYKVYILHRVVIETLTHCKKTDPKEAIGILLGYKYQYKEQKYVKVVDWVTGKANQSHAYAEFTPDGVRQYTTLIEEKYGESENRPKIVGIFHSHPFGSNPHFSSTDYNTFLNFPYDAEHNVFVLIDPKSDYFKSYIVVIAEKGMKNLKEVDWVEYTAR
ncbi:MAG: Mov34/MPN/PAD-1 family protein [Candidatus Heimdallarchaeota archaeon]|nr:Mov34/MPN/PAD-1 family protein [Candidatus Heimdallarchaeota archaeon]